MVDFLVKIFEKWTPSEINLMILLILVFLNPIIWLIRSISELRRLTSISSRRNIKLNGSKDRIDFIVERLEYTENKLDGLERSMFELKKEVSTMILEISHHIREENDILKKIKITTKLTDILEGKSQ